MGVRVAEKETCWLGFHMERFLALAENGAGLGIWSQPQRFTRLFSCNGFPRAHLPIDGSAALAPAIRRCARFPPGYTHSLALPPSLDELWRAGAATGTTDGCFARLSMTDN